MKQPKKLFLRVKIKGKSIDYEFISPLSLLQKSKPYVRRLDNGDDLTILVEE